MYKKGEDGLRTMGINKLKNMAFNFKPFTVDVN